jgi:putative ABC transport system permease protein
MSSSMRGERSELSLRMVGRLRQGVSLAQARSEVEAIWKRLAESYPGANRDRTIKIASLHDSIVLDYNRQFALLLMGVVGMVLLIACTNMSAVQFARAVRRRSETAVRAALGASRPALFRQFFVENMLLAIAGGALGILLAIYGVVILRHTLPSDVRWFCDVDSLRVNTASLLFTTLVTIAAGMFSGLAPAWRSSKADLSGVLAEGATRIAGHRSHFWRAALVVTETAMATILLIGAALMTKGFALLAKGQPGLSPASMLTFHITLPQERYSDQERIEAFEKMLLDQIRNLRSVRAAALASGIPYSFYENDSQITAQDSPVAGPGQQESAMVDSVSPEYFRAMQIPLRAGRQFSISDSSVSLQICIVSQSMAQRLWPGQSALGKRIKIGSNDAVGKWITVVGIATDVQHEIYDRSFRSILYVPYTQNSPSSADFVIRTEGDPLQFAAAARAVVRKLDPSLAVEDLQTLSGLIRSQASAPQYVAGLMSAFALLGLVLAFVGVYGVMANSVAERWRELAIRMALGARSWRLLLTVIGRAFLFSATGMALGLFLSLSLARLLSSLIYGVSAWDSVTFIFVPLLLAAIALLACYAPARCAVRMDPMVALRYE